MSERICYICKQPYTRVHTFYDQLCPPCADVNFAARSELADLRWPDVDLTGPSHVAGRLGHGQTWGAR